ncbi:hypothetical protein [Alkaliphilus sp. B6464]|uniref:hypothetical protein n=1 Tax=Alkaliphilus sp. B6464 TaxID=2731219 RepID=UPI001BABA4EF|nr:hypothetical protein [Alkaliphilus sp. B6464]QUH21835.1 hypothetical protein HYG84_18025 [Alkaliphilus sp. B6464]
MFNELVEIVKKGNVKYHLYQHDLMINTDVLDYEIDSDFINLKIAVGYITIWCDSILDKCRRPDNLIIECEYCFRIYNQYKEPIGYLYGLNN